MNDLRFINLSSYTTPKVVEYKNKEWVAYGEDNNYFKYLIDRYNGSPTNNAIINAISAMIYGRGLDATNSNQKPDQYAKMISLFNADCTRKLCYDLKLMGQCAMQVIYSKDRNTIAQIEHFPVETLRAEKCNDDGDIEAYYYFSDWSKYKPTSKAKRIPAFGTSNEAIEILYVRPYRAGFHYYSPVDYQGGLQYSELEEEIGNFHLNNIMNGMSPSMLINFNNGVPNEEERELIEQRIYQKFSGTSNSGKFILAFNDNAETAANIEPVQLSDAHQQYQFLSEESTRKIMVSHRIVSPMLIGIKDQTGLGNNADELKTASTLLDNTVIRPFQHLLIDAFDQILAYNKISLKLYFKTLQPLEFTDLENVEDEETKEEETGVKLKQEDLSDEEFDIILDELRGEKISNRWEEVDAREYSSENIDIEEWATKNIESKEQQLEKRSIDSKKSGFSYLDKSLYKVRYKYSQKYSSGKSRQFCRIMMARSQRGVVYRIEDIDKASRAGVNRSFGHKGRAYDLFKYKGGPNCGHFFSEVLYRLKSKTMKKKIQNYDEVKSIPKSYKPTPAGHKKAKVAPKDMPNNGHHPNFK
jgi:hypothetical protein|tara:strand:+ start:3732 stop:5483 length:1752 start_codon:yes stop_codon:yes gene_type:complete